MRPKAYWSLSLAIGAAVAAGTYEFAGWHVGAVGTGLLYVVAFGLLFRTHQDLRSRVTEWNDIRASLWSGAFGGIVAVAASIPVNTLDLPLAEGAAIGLVVFGAATVGLAIGVGMTLAYLDRAERDGAAQPSHTTG